jgi:hypothetical protein
MIETRQLRSLAAVAFFFFIALEPKLWTQLAPYERPER